MAVFRKIAIPLTVSIIVALPFLGMLAPPVQRTTFPVSDPAALNQDLLAENLRNLEGVFGMRLEAGGRKLVVDHCPELEPGRLAGSLAEWVAVGEVRNSRRIMAIRALAFPAEQRDVLTSGRSCRPDSPCSTGASWKKLLGRWQNR